MKEFLEFFVQKYKGEIFTNAIFASDLTDLH